MNEGNDKDKIVPRSPTGLTTRDRGLVRRGLRALTVSVPKIARRVLVADDQEAINEVIAGILGAAGYEVKTTTHPSEVVALVDDFRPEVALIGLIAPEVDGVKLGKELAARFPRLKIVLTGEEVPEVILRLLLDAGVACDTLDLPFEPNDLLEMTSAWASGSDYIDGASRLRDAKHFRMGLLGNIGADNFKSIGLVNYSKPLIIFVELCERAPSCRRLQNEISFLRSLGVLLARYARHGFAYRYGETQFAVLLPHTNKEEGFTSSKWLVQELKPLLKEHKLGDDYFAAVGIVSLPGDAQSIEQVQQAAHELLARAKTSETKIALFEPLEPIIKDTWTGLYTEQFFMEALDAELKRSERNKGTFSLIDIDLGDLDAVLGKSRAWLTALLSYVGDTIDKACRRVDVCCHYNLGEFLILLPDTPTETACGSAQQLHSRLGDAAAHVLSGFRPPLMLSVATYPADGTTPVDLVLKMREAMLLLKNSTGDGVAAASKASSPHSQRTA